MRHDSDVGGAPAVDVELFESSSCGLRAQAQAGALDVLRRGRTTLTIGLDNLSTVGDAVVSALIVALRTMRDSGGTMRLRTGKNEHRQRLSLNGLDRIFSIADA